MLKHIFLTTLFLSCTEAVLAQELHYVPAPKALMGHEFPFGEKDQTLFRMKNKEDIVIPGSTKEYWFEWQKGKTAYVMCKLEFDSVLFERKIAPNESYLLNAAPKKSSLNEGTLNLVTYSVLASKDADVPVKSIECRKSVAYTKATDIKVSEIQCFLEVWVKAPINRNNPALNCAID